MNILSRKGISLLEVLMAIALLGITMASLLSLYLSAGSFYQRLFPLDVSSLRDCIESHDFLASEAYVSLTDENRWVCSDSLTEEGDSVCLVRLTQVSSSIQYELVEVFSVLNREGEAHVSNVSLLTYIR